MNYSLLCIFFVVVLSLGIFGFFFSKKIAQTQKKALEESKLQSEKIIAETLKKSEELANAERKNLERLRKEKLLELQKMEARIRKKEETLDRKSESLEKREKETDKNLQFQKIQKDKLEEQLVATQKFYDDSKRKLEEVARLSIEEARQELRKSIERDTRKTLATEMRVYQDQVRQSAQNDAKSIISTAIQKVVGEFVSDACISVVPLPSEDMKGRIIGREGRNIRAIEQITGVDIIIDDTPEAVVLSCFNPIRREVARLVLESLMSDGRIHPARIEETTQKIEKEMDNHIREIGEKVLLDFNIGKVHPEIVLALGRLKFKTTGQQSVLQHSIECLHIAEKMALEIKYPTSIVKRAALFHDIGKAIEETVEGHHSDVGADFLEHYGELPEVVYAVRNHHESFLQDAPMSTILLSAANTLSHLRPGARKENLEKSIQRMTDLEKIVSSHPAVEKAFVLQSGREVRAMVYPDKLNDEALIFLTQELAQKIHSQNLTHGVTITLVREFRITEVAR